MRRSVRTLQYDEIPRKYESLLTLGHLNNMNLLYQNFKIGKGAEALVDSITLVNQCEVFKQAYRDSKYNYMLNFVKTKMIEY